MGMTIIETTNVRIKLAHPNAKVPTYGSAEAAGADLYAAFDGPAIALAPGERKLIPVGIAIELLPGYEAQVRPRSGLALKHGLTVVNAPGTVDSDYRGEIGVILLNTSDVAYHVNSGDRIAQMVIAPVIRGEFSVVDELDSSERGAGGYGSTGKN